MSWRGPLVGETTARHQIWYLLMKGYQLDHGTAQKLTDLGIDTAAIFQQDDVGYTNRILASDADDATKKAENMKLLEAN